jgi:hypothetical protein
MSVMTGLARKAVFRKYTKEQDFAEAAQMIGRIIWEREDLENRHFDNAVTPDNERVLKFTRTLTKAALEKHSNFDRWMEP